MIAYFDASALVKRYVSEDGSRFVASRLRKARPTTARYSFIEIASALCRRCRGGDISESERDRALDALSSDASRLVVVELTPAVADTASALLRRHDLRAGDAAQLASCLHVNGRLGGVDFIAFDARLNRAAAAEGLETPAATR